MRATSVVGPAHEAKLSRWRLRVRYRGYVGGASNVCRGALEMRARQFRLRVDNVVMYGPVVCELRATYCQLTSEWGASINEIGL